MDSNVSQFAVGSSAATSNSRSDALHETVGHTSAPSCSNGVCAAGPSTEPGVLERKPATASFKQTDAILDLLPFGFVVLDISGRILSLNATASEILRNTSDLTNDRGFLRARSVSHGRALAKALETLGATNGPEPVGFSFARSHQRPLSLVLARLPSRTKAVQTPKQVRIGLFLADPASDLRPAAVLLRDLFEFTPVESSIAVLMIQSEDTSGIAGRLGITRNTLRGHLRSMFIKTGTSSQLQLLHTLLRSPVWLRFGSCG